MQYGTVTGRFLAAVVDTPADEDLEPDAVPLAGTVTFTPSAQALRVVTAGATILPMPISGTLDADGYLTLNGTRGISLIATDTDETNPRDFTYKVTFTGLNYGGVPVAYPGFSIAVPAGQTINLTEVAPVAEAKGAIITRGEKGEPGGTFTYDPDEGLYVADDADPIPAVDPDTNLLTPVVREAMARALSDPTTPEGAAITQVAGTSAVTVGSTAAMSAWFTALGKVRAGTGNAKLLCVGDSTTAGFSVGQASSWPALLNQRLNRDIATQQGLSICMNLDVDSARWSLGGWQTVFGPGSGALYQDPDKSGADAVFTPDVDTDTIDSWWYLGAGKGKFVVKIDGVAQPAIDTLSPNGSYGWRNTTYTVNSGKHTVALQRPTVAPVSVLGVDAYVSTLNSVRVSNWGVSGSLSNTWANGPYSLDGISGYAPDLTIVMLGINDANDALPVETWKANIAAIVAEAKKSGDVILMSVAPSDPATSALSYEQQYRDASPALAASLDVPFLDMFGKIGSYSSDRYSDSLHPNARGHADMARIVSAGLRAI